MGWESSNFIKSPFRRTHHARQGSREGERYRAQRHTENSGNFPIAQTLGPQKQTTPILFGECFDDGHQAFAILTICRLVFGVGRRVWGVLLNSRFRAFFPIPAAEVAALQT